MRYAMIAGSYDRGNGCGGGLATATLDDGSTPLSPPLAPPPPATLRGIVPGTVPGTEDEERLSCDRGDDTDADKLP